MDSRHDAHIKAEAFDWLVGMGDPNLDPEEPYADLRSRWAAFWRWFAESPDHLHAFVKAVQISSALRHIDSRDAIDVEELLRNARNNVVQIAQNGAEASSSLSASGAGRKSARQTTKRLPLLASVVLVMLLILPLLFESIDAWPARYDASIGQRIFVPLEDHSTIELNTRTHLEVLFGPRSRVVTLLAGEAIFDVRHDSSRPFRVISGNTIIKDVGTKFAVYRHADGTTTVTVLEGRVVISSTTGKKGLQEGGVATVGVRRGQPILQVENLPAREIRRRLSWQTGSLSFEGETLAEVIAEVNRYNERQLVIEDPTVANWRLGGTFQAVDLDAFLAALEHSFNLHALPVPNRSNEIELQWGQESQ